MRYYPYRYQSRATDFILTHNKCAIMLNFGRGKKVITLTALHALYFDCFENWKTLIITSKTSAKTRWISELQKWDHLKDLSWSLVMGNEKEKRRALQKNSNLYITNKECLLWLIKNELWSFDTIVIDNMADFGNEKTKRFQALSQIQAKLSRIIGLSSVLPDDNLSGLWSTLYLLDAGKRLGKNKSGFYERYFFTTKNWYAQQVQYQRTPKEGAHEAIKSAISDICFTMSEADYIDVPSCTYRNIFVELNSTELSKYQFLKGLLFDTNDSKKNISQLLQLASGSFCDNKNRLHMIHHRKLNVLDELIRENCGNNILIAYSFPQDKEVILQLFPNAKVIETERDILDWNKNKISLALMDSSINRTNSDMYLGGNLLIWYSLPRSKELYHQMNERIYGSVERNKVIIIHILTRNTIDEELIDFLTQNEHTNKFFQEIYRITEDFYE